MESEKSVYSQQFNPNTDFIVKGKFLIIPYLETPNSQNTCTTSSMKDVDAKVPSHLTEGSTNHPQLTKMVKHPKKKNSGPLAADVESQALAAVQQKAETPNDNASQLKEEMTAVLLNERNINDLKGINVQASTADDGSLDTANENKAIMAKGVARGQETAAVGLVPRNKKRAIHKSTFPAKVKLIERIVRNARNLYRKSNYMLCHWIHPKASKQEIQHNLDNMWETIATEDRLYFIRQVLEKWGVGPRPEGNPQLRPLTKSAPSKTRNYRPGLRKDPRLDLVEILPPPQPVASFAEPQKLNQNCGEAQNTVVCGVSIKRNDDGIENSENDPPPKKPKLHNEKNDPESKSSCSSQEFRTSPEVQEVLDKIELMFRNKV